MLVDSLPPMECIWAMQDIMDNGAEWPFSIEIRIMGHNLVEAKMNPLSKFSLDELPTHDNDNTPRPLKPWRRR